MTTQSSLHLLLDAIEHTTQAGSHGAYEHGVTAGPSSSFSSSHPMTVISPPPRTFTNLHIPCERSSSFTPPQPKALNRSSTSNSFSNPSTSHHSSHKKKARKNIRRATRSQTKAKEARRRELKERAINIYSVENSPVNEQQLLVLRMVYDEITPYPSDAWMVLLAITIRRCVIISSYSLQPITEVFITVPSSKSRIGFPTSGKNTKLARWKKQSLPIVTICAYAM